MNEKFKGIFPALLTPFDGQGRVDTEVLGRLVDYNLQKGVDGFYVAGSTAEVFLLDAKERLAVMEAVSSRAGGKCTLIAHIGCISTKQAIEYAREAKEMGYDAISSVAPFYYKFSFEEIRLGIHPQENQPIVFVLRRIENIRIQPRANQRQQHKDMQKDCALCFRSI